MTEVCEDIVIIKEKVVSGCVRVLLYDQNLVEIIWDNQIVQIEKNHVAIVKDILAEFSTEKKLLVYVSTFDMMTVSKEAMKFSASEENQKFTFANAVLVDSLAKRIIFNFFISVQKSTTPIRAFSTRENAIKWLLKKNENRISE